MTFFSLSRKHFSAPLNTLLFLPQDFYPKKKTYCGNSLFIRKQKIVLKIGWVIIPFYFFCRSSCATIPLGGCQLRRRSDTNTSKEKSEEGFFFRMKWHCCTKFINLYFFFVTWVMRIINSIYRCSHSVLVILRGLEKYCFRFHVKWWLLQLNHWFVGLLLPKTILASRVL